MDAQRAVEGVVRMDTDNHTANRRMERSVKAGRGNAAMGARTAVRGRAVSVMVTVAVAEEPITPVRPPMRAKKNPLSIRGVSR